MTMRSVLSMMILVPGLWSPASAQIMVVGKSVQEREVRPGERYTGEIRLRNQGAEPKAIRVYQTDYLFYADGSNLYPAAGSHPRSNADWTTVMPTDLIVPGGQETSVSYEVAVPEELTGAGTYWSMIMVEPTEPPRDPASGEDPSIGLRTTIRFGIQVATHVAGEAQHRLGIGNPRLTLDHPGLPHLQFELVNEGQVGFRPNVAVEIYDGAGTLRKTLEAQRGLIYPGTSALQAFDLAELTAGTYEAIVVVDTGGQEIFGAQFTLTIEAPG